MIFLDLDGVLVNFIKATCKAFDLDEIALMKSWPAGLWDMDQLLGMDEGDFFSKIDLAGEQFWSEAELYPWADELFNFCESLAPTYILSAPTRNPLCLSGKVKLLQRWKGVEFRQYVLTPRKECCAKAGNILIDDYTRNVLRFREHGGEAILFPMHTNDNHEKKDIAMDWTKKELTRLMHA